MFLPLQLFPPLLLLPTAINCCPLIPKLLMNFDLLSRHMASKLPLMTPSLNSFLKKTLISSYLTVLTLSIFLSTFNFDGLKDAHAVPILKSLQLDREDFKSYRPVSLLSFVSKLTERVVHKRITDYLSANNLHVPSQYGYKRHHS